MHARMSNSKLIFVEYACENTKILKIIFGVNVPLKDQNRFLIFMRIYLVYIITSFLKKYRQQLKTVILFLAG
jgi:hypothetical protein